MALNDQRQNYISSSDDFQILATTLTGNSGWQDVSHYGQWSVFVSGLETGATVKVEVANGQAGPANGIVKAASIAPDPNGNASFDAGSPYHWVRVTKTQGTTPTASTAQLFGHRT